MPYCRNCGSQLQEVDNFCETCGTARRKASSITGFTVKTCPYCQFPIKDVSEVNTCSLCNIPHHRECWAENGGCTTFGCSGLTGESESQLITMQSPATSVADQSSELSRLANIAAAVDPAVPAGLDADYYIDYRGGTIPIGDLPIGTRVVDPSWVWKFRTCRDYTYELGDETKPVNWIVVAYDHYDLNERHVTLLSEELIGKYVFDRSPSWLNLIPGKNQWGYSGTGKATCGLRRWLNSTGIHSGEGFYRAFSEGFRQAVLTTNVPNKEWKKGSAYTNSDQVFIPSTTELGDIQHRRTCQIGSVYPYFEGADGTKRVAMLGENIRWYWTRSPDSHFGRVRIVLNAGGFYSSVSSNFQFVRPVLNLKSGILVSEIKN